MATVTAGMTTSLDGFVADPSGSADRLQIDVVPVLLGDGLRLLEHIGRSLVRLEKVDVKEIGARTSLTFRVVRG